MKKDAVPMKAAKVVDLIDEEEIASPIADERAEGAVAEDADGEEQPPDVAAGERESFAGGQADQQQDAERVGFHRLVPFPGVAPPRKQRRQRRAEQVFQRPAGQGEVG